MNFRNAKYNEDGSVDVEMEHPEYGWIPFTASPDDVEAHGREIYQAAIAGDFGPVAEYIPPPEPTYEEKLAAARESASLTRREFFLGLDAMGIYDTVMSAALPRVAQIELDTATSFDRNWPTLVDMATQLGFTDADLDTLFGIEVMP